MAVLSALWIVSLAEPLFGYPLVADAPEVEMLIAPTRRGRQHDNDHGDADRENDQPSVHDRPMVPAVASNWLPIHRDIVTGSATPISATDSALGRGDVPATMHDRRVTDVALAAIHKRKWREDMQVRPFASTSKTQKRRQLFFKLSLNSQR